MQCTHCDNYNRGHGQPACLKCQKYKDILLQSVRRNTIAIDVVPDTILNNIPDPRSITILDAIRQLPLELSMPLLAYHILGANQREIANHYNISRRAVQGKIKKSIEIIKELTITSD
jgi:DNA-directed RNA polymerase specialized sigma24 family protein